MILTALEKSSYADSALEILSVVLVKRLVSRQEKNSGCSAKLMFDRGSNSDVVGVWIVEEC